MPRNKVCMQTEVHTGAVCAGDLWPGRTCVPVAACPGAARVGPHKCTTGTATSWPGQAALLLVRAES